MYPRLRSSSPTTRSLCLTLAYAFMLSLVTPMASARGHFPSGNKGRLNAPDNDKPVAIPGAPAGKRLPDIDQERGRRHSSPKAPPAIPSSRPRWSTSSVPGRLIPPPAPVTPQVITGNTESAGVVFNNQDNRDLDGSFAAQNGLLASAAAGFRDTLPPVYWSAAIPAIINESYSMIFASAGSISQDARARQTGMSVLLDQPQTIANGLVMSSLPAPVPFERLVISEFRFRGPGGVADEYIQLTNITGQSITVSTSDGSSGWALAAISTSGSTSTKFVIPNGTVIPQGAHYLAANSAYSLTGYATPDRSYTGDISDNTGIALFRTSNSANFILNERIDAAGFTPVTNSLYREGSGLTAITAGTNQYAHVRKMTTPLPQDTDNNSADFVLISTAAASLGGVTSVLGAPGPENSLSPLDRTSQILYESLDPGVGATAPPNRVRNTTPVPNGAFGTLAIRSKITNNTGFPITRMRFRIFDFTTTNSPVVTTPPQAVLTMLDSADSNITLSNGATVSVKGTKVEQPPNQLNAGGINTTHAPGGITLTTPLQPGQSFYREMKFGVNANGSFRYNATVELLLSGGASADPSQDNFSAARLDPANQTGSSGEDLASRNLNWSLPLVSLPGRAGLDLGLSLAYNSLVWTKSGSAIKFDADNGFPAPGFRLGFPVIERRYHDSVIATNAFLMITPSGRRVQLRQIGTSNLYETGDSSFMQLTDNGSTLVVRPTDGSQLTYSLIGDAYYCTQIKDRNGNFITASYGAQGQLLSVLDTLGRVINFNYDSFQNLLSITQTRNIGTPSQFTHTWATFGYSDLTVQTNYPGLSVVGPGNGSVIPALTQVGLADGTKYNFTYNTWGQVYRIGRSTPRSDNPSLYRERNYVSYNLPLNAAGGQSDCPRFTERRDWAENWNGDNDSVPVAGEEALTTFSAHNFAGGVTTVTVPDGTQYKEFFVGTSPAWQRGITTQTETWSGGVRRKWTTTAWTQDNTGLAYQKNPRVIETNIFDEAGNRKRTTIDYGSYVAYGLPYLITEYGIGGAGILRQTYIDYNLDSAYVSRRIIGLVSAQQVSNGSAWQSKTVYAYDTGTLANTSAIQHDAAYNTGFVTGRGNVTSVARYDVNDIGNATKALTTTIGYNVDGSVVFSRDPLSHQNSLSYTDSFADGIARNTFAYPTTATDPGLFTSTSKYSFDTGSVTQQQTPQPNTTANQPGPIQTFAYDAIGRIQRVTNLFNGAFTEFVYPQDLMIVQSFTTIRDDSIGNQSLRAYSAKVFDGAGRVMGTIGSHPGSVGGYTATDINYDVMGRAIEQSNPTETSGSWVPSGDDAAGWLYTRQTYDWNGRPRITTNPDGTTKEASYTGCGCAGGAVVTLTDEGTIDAGTPKRRQQKIYADVLGRTVKTEVLNWQGGSVYSVTVNTYNARDQVEQIRQYAGAEGSPTVQTTTMSYDGYGRLKTKHAPQEQVDQANPASTDHTTWDYNLDDTIQKITDARGASQTLSYNSRHLVTNITYAAPGGANISAAAAVTLAYDAAGNRTTMTDGFGSRGYNYDQLSRLTSETRGFSVGSYGITYAYNLVDDLTSITDPFGASFAYQRDAQGQLKTVTGSPYAGVTNYVADVNYRAWGAPRSVSYSDRSSTLAYNARMEPSQFRLTFNSNGASIIRENYNYYGDGRVSSLTDLDDTVGNNPPSTIRTLSRGYSYDHLGRVTGSGGSAGGGAVPYTQSYSYDEFGNMNGRSGRYYGYNNNPFSSDSATYTNNRRNGWSYKADGQVAVTPASSTDAGRNMLYDAAGRLVTTIEFGQFTTINYSSGYDGDGQLVYESSNASGVTETSYIVRSTALAGEVLTRLNQSGGKKITHVPAEGLLFATQQAVSGSVLQTYRNPLGTTETNKAVYDPLGNYIPFQAFNDPRPPAGSYSSASMGSLSASLANPHAYGTGCMLDGLPTNCSLTSRLQNNGSAGQCPDNYCGPRYNGSGFEFLHFTEEGTGYGQLNQYQYAHAQRRTPPTLKRGKSRPRRVGGTRPRTTTGTQIGVEGTVGSSLFDPLPILIERFDANREREIWSALAKLFTDRCSAAFERASLRPPRFLARHEGLIVRPSSDLRNYSSAQLGIMRDQDRIDGANNFSSTGLGSPQGFTIPAFLNGVQLTSDFRTQIYLSPLAFDGESYFWGQFSFQDVMSHEFIHGAGKQGEKFPLLHDLKFFGPHNKILEACR